MLRVAASSGFKASRCGAVASTQTFGRFMSTTRYSLSHEYIKMDGDVGTVGITDFAAAALGDVVFVDLPSVGTSFEKKDIFGSVESVKAASDVYSPVAGEVVAVNEVLEESPAKVNESPFDQGWFMKIKVSAEGKLEFDKLLDEKAYKKHTEDSAH